MVSPLPAPVCSVSLRIDQIRPWQRRSEDLLERAMGRSGPEQQDWDQLMDVLCARLGNNQVYGVLPREDHRPERAWMRQPLTEDRRMRKTVEAQGQSIDLPGRPCWLLGKPHKIAADQRITILERVVERIESGWWDGCDARRDYYRAVTRSGGRCWVYKKIESIRGDSTVSPGNDIDYYLHGLYG